MIRIREEIKKEVKSLEEEIETIIKDSAEDKKYEEECLDEYRRRLKELLTEVYFEDTLEGKVVELEEEAKRKIEVIIKELSAKTGKNYKHELSLCSDNFNCPSFTYFNRDKFKRMLHGSNYGAFPSEYI